MFRFDITTPNRDGSLDAMIPLHEYTHGISNRLTGGSFNGRCLQTTESGGMGEGWSDAVAIILTRNANHTRLDDIAIGWYVTNTPSNGNGIRKYKYSTNMKTNPHVFSELEELNEEHAIGEVWAAMIVELYWNLVDKYGFSANLLDATQSQGNVVAMQLLIGGMTRQPCNPSFIQARDAILHADIDFYGGENKCDIWKAFAKRGLGSNAQQTGHVDGFNVPRDCHRWL